MPRSLRKTSAGCSSSNRSRLSAKLRRAAGKKRAPGICCAFSITGPVPKSARRSAKRATSVQNVSAELSDQAYRAAKSSSVMPRRAFTHRMKRVRFASAMRAAEGRHSSLIRC